MGLLTTASLQLLYRKSSLSTQGQMSVKLTSWTAGSMSQLGFCASLPQHPHLIDSSINAIVTMYVIQ